MPDLPASPQAPTAPHLAALGTDADTLAAVLDAVEAEHAAALDLLDTLVAIPSTGGSPAEVEVQHLLAEVLAGDGCSVELWPLDLDELTADPAFPGMEVARTSAYGLIGTLRGHAPELGRSLLVDGHTDVVPPGDLGAWTGDPYRLRREERNGVEVLIGRGTCDMKGGLVAAIAAMRAVRAAGVRLAGDLTIAPVVGEEDGGLGTFALMRSGVRADACVVPEPTDLDLVPANGGALTFRLLVRGRAVHASRRTEGVSALEMFLPVLEAVSALEERRNAAVDPLVSRWPIAYPISIGTVHAGDWASTVPDLLVAEGRMGVALGEDAATARRELEDAVAAACAAHPFLRAEPVAVQWWGGQFASGRSVDEAWLSAVRRAHAAALPSWRAPQTYGAPYGSDLRLLAPYLPTVQYGPGDTRHAHAPDEHISRAELEASTRALAVLYLEHCGVV